MRLDAALFALRWFKSRTQATSAIERGGVRLNGRAVRPSHPVKVGDRVSRQEGSGERTFEILDLPPASLRKQDAERLLREVPGPAAPDREG